MAYGKTHVTCTASAPQPPQPPQSTRDNPWFANSTCHSSLFDYYGSALYGCTGSCCFLTLQTFIHIVGKWRHSPLCWKQNQFIACGCWYLLRLLLVSMRFERVLPFFIPRERRSVKIHTCCRQWQTVHDVRTNTVSCSPSVLIKCSICPYHQTAYQQSFYFITDTTCISEQFKDIQEVTSLILHCKTM